MGRNRSVGIGTVRLPIADVYIRAHRELETQFKAEKATQDQFDLSAASVAEAESDHEFLTVKAELNAGEQRRVFSGMVKEQQAGKPISIDAEKVGLTRIAEYLLGWSFLQDGQPLPLNPGQEDADRAERMRQINSVDTETYGELVAAIDWHVEQIESARDARKKSRAGTLPSEAISASAA